MLVLLQCSIKTVIIFIERIESDNHAIIRAKWRRKRFENEFNRFFIIIRSIKSIQQCLNSTVKWWRDYKWEFVDCVVWSMPLKSIEMIMNKKAYLLRSHRHRPIISFRQTVIHTHTSWWVVLQPITFSIYPSEQSDFTRSRRQIVMISNKNPIPAKTQNKHFLMQLQNCNALLSFYPSCYPYTSHKIAIVWMVNRKKTNQTIIISDGLGVFSLFFKLLLSIYVIVFLEQRSMPGTYSTKKS